MWLDGPHGRIPSAGVPSASHAPGREHARPGYNLYRIERGDRDWRCEAVSRGLAETTAGTGVAINTVLAGPTASEGVDKFVEQLATDQRTDRVNVEREFFGTMRPI